MKALFAFLFLSLASTSVFAADSCEALTLNGKFECSLGDETIRLSVAKKEKFHQVTSLDDKETFLADGKERLRYAWSEDHSYQAYCFGKTLIIESYSHGGMESRMFITPKGSTISYQIEKPEGQLTLSCKKI